MSELLDKAELEMARFDKFSYPTSLLLLSRLAELEAEVGGLKVDLNGWKRELNAADAENAKLREALRTLYGCLAIDPIPLSKEVQRIVGEALKEGSDA